jgi:tetratricopeptide (TPR) repeat protein
MFVARAQEARPSFTLTDDVAPIVAEICRRLDGLPLALELAAARTRLLPPRTLLARLDRRLPILTDGPRDLPARQRTLRDTIGWSYGLLDEDERRVFRLLGVFVGGCTLDAIEHLAAHASRPATGGVPHLTAPNPQLATLDIVASLVDKSLVRQTADGDQTRFLLLETIREFALDQLDTSGESSLGRASHAEYFLALVEAADPRLTSGDQVSWLDRLEAEHGNLVAALAWAREAQMAADRTVSGVPASLAGLRLAGGLHWFWWLGGHIAEGRHWLDEILTWDAGELSLPARLRALYAVGTLAMIQGSYDDAFRLLDEGIRLAAALGDVVTQAHCLIYRGIIQSYFHDDADTEERASTEAYERAAALLESTNDSWGQALAASLIGVQVRRAGDYPRAEALLRHASDLARATGERYLIGSCLPKLGTLYVEQGAYEEAKPLYVEALAAFREIREAWWSARCMHYLSVAAFGQGDHLLALLLVGIADTILDANGARRNPREERDRTTVVTGLQGALSEATFADTYERGRQLSIDAVLELLSDVPAGTGKPNEYRVS